MATGTIPALAHAMMISSGSSFHHQALNFSDRLVEIASREVIPEDLERVFLAVSNDTVGGGTACFAFHQMEVSQQLHAV